MTVTIAGGSALTSDAMASNKIAAQRHTKDLTVLCILSSIGFDDPFSPQRTQTTASLRMSPPVKRSRGARERTRLIGPRSEQEEILWTPPVLRDWLTEQEGLEPPMSREVLPKENGANVHFGYNPFRYDR